MDNDLYLETLKNLAQNFVDKLEECEPHIYGEEKKELKKFLEYLKELDELNK